ncbi:MAG: helix-turn-helix domain-containing protein [Candidatus Omnitrophica bacterium]|nr:helix-turn-helix domain-containing protein [Candidatus Omnitrophota bacterium]
MSNPIKRACNILGGQPSLARALGVSTQAVNKWVKRNFVPPVRAIQIEKATNGQVTRHELRPDLYPTEDHAA